jgi:hypothetical protein
VVAHGALHAVEQMLAERSAGVLTSSREKQEQAREVDRRRVQVAVRIAELEGIDDWRSGSRTR